MIVDLTMVLDENTPVFPDCPRQVFEQVATIEDKGWNERRLSFSSHFGTHIDAPFHLLDKGKYLDQFPIDKFVGDAIVIDARNQNPIEPDLCDVKEDDIVFFFTGFIDKAYTDRYYKDYPVLSMKTAEELVKKKAKIIGLDSWTPDRPPFDMHKLFFRNDILILENLVNLDKVVGKRIKCFVLPLRLKDADAAPCRVIGIL